MLTRLPRLIAIRCFALLLLATIALQASEPVRGLEYQRGSAFSAATSDVAIAASRRTAAAQLAPAPLPQALPEIPLTVPAAPLRLAAVPARPDSTGPPRPRRLARPAEPRAPPLLT